LDAVVVQAAIQGQAVVFSSGDAGDNTTATGKRETTWPPSNPWITAVGGTSVALDGAGHVVFTTGWEDTGNAQNGSDWTRLASPFIGGAGGGVSGIYDQPDYQAGVVPTSIAHGKRAVPDVSAVANAYTGIRI